MSQSISGNLLSQSISNFRKINYSPEFKSENQINNK